MGRIGWVGFGILAAAAFVGCGDGPDSGTGGAGGGGGRGGAGGAVFETFVSFANVVVGDGVASTDVAVVLRDEEIESDLAYQSIAERRKVRLFDATEDVTAEARLDATGDNLTPGASIPLVSDAPSTVYLIGDVDGAAPSASPRWLTLPTLTPPEAGTFRMRAIHALVGVDAAVDVYANGVVFSDLPYGAASEPVDATVGAPGTDSLVVTEAGVPPNEETDLFRASGESLFETDGRYDLVISHEGTNLNGDINGAITVWIATIAENE
ncbi:MAG: hypothetical protein WBG86_00815 [Polyangiales bacterium]